MPGGLPAAQALIIVDMQAGFVDGDQAVPSARTLLGNVWILLTAARKAGAFVVHVQNDGSAGEIDEPDQPGWQLVLSPSRSEPVIRKKTDDGFAGTDLGPLLVQQRVQRVVICGLLSEMCVSATARGALASGLAVTLPHDAHSTYDLSDIPADTVARVAEHALGDGIDVVSTSPGVSFEAPPLTGLRPGPTSHDPTPA